MNEDDWKAVEEWAKSLDRGPINHREGRVSKELLRRCELDELHAAAVGVANGLEGGAYLTANLARYRAAKAALTKKADPWAALKADLGGRFITTTGDGNVLLTNAGWESFIKVIEKHCVLKEPPHITIGKPTTGSIP